MTTTTDGVHVLYRFYCQARLLYVGITADHGVRWRQHEKSKPWWAEVTHATMEQHPDRASVLAAEREAIRTEEPEHNVVHNRGRRHHRRQVASVQVSHGDLMQLAHPLARGNWAALGMFDGGCPVGFVQHATGQDVELVTVSWLTGYLTGDVVVVAWEDIACVRTAHTFGIDALGPAVDLDDLALFQRSWRGAGSEARRT